MEGGRGPTRASRGSESSGLGEQRLCLFDERYLSEICLSASRRGDLERCRALRFRSRDRECADSLERERCFLCLRCESSYLRERDPSSSLPCLRRWCVECRDARSLLLSRLLGSRRESLLRLLCLRLCDSRDLSLCFLLLLCRSSSSVSSSCLRRPAGRGFSPSLSTGVKRPSAFLEAWSLSFLCVRSFSRFISLRRAFDSSASFASSAALWLSVCRIMCRKKLVLGFGAPDFALWSIRWLQFD